MAGWGDADCSALSSQSNQTQSNSNQEKGHRYSPADILQEKLGEVTSCAHGSTEDAKKELEVLWRRVKTTASLLTYLKSKARIMTTSIPHLALTSHGITQSDNMDFSNFDCTEVERWIGINNQHGVLDEQDEVYIAEMLKSVEMITDVMESLLKRVIMAESETASEKQKVTLSQEEIMKKEIQIETMSEKLDEMNRFAVDTTCVLNEMRQWVDDLVEETSRQRLRATENEEELVRVKQEFESLKSYVSTLMSVRETLVSSEKQFQTIEKLFEQLVVKTTQLESEKKQKETEVQKLMDENVRLNALLDKKEAQLLAMNEQCKVMALRATDI